MPRLRGQSPIQGQGSGFGADDFYSASKATVFPTYRPRVERVPGQSKYATPELEAAQRPYADIGKLNVNLFDPGGPQYQTPVGQPVTTTPAQPGAAEIMKSMQLPWMDKAKGESLGGVPGMEFVGGGLDFLSNVAGSIPQAPTPAAAELYTKLASTPDEQLSETERRVKSLNAGLFGRAPDSPLMQGKQVGEMYKAYQIAEAHRKGSSAMLLPSPGTQGPLDMTPIGGALQAYGQLSNMFRRALGSLPFNDQLGAVTDPAATEKSIGEERWAIREQLQSGQINEEEARDMIAMSSFALSNPDPVKLGGEFGPLDTVANAGIALAGEFISDPLSVPAIVATGGTYLAKTPVQATLRSVTRSVARDIVETAGKDIASAAGDEAYQVALKQVTAEATRIAQEQGGQQALFRRLPKEATVAAKQTGKITEAAVTDADRLEALLSMGAEDHPWSAAISRGIEGAGSLGYRAVKYERIAKAATAIDKMVDPFSLFGYWRTGRTVPMALSKQAAHGGLDALGWRVARRLDGAYAEAGVDPLVAQSARDISFANHTVQVGDRANTARMVMSNSAFTSGMNPTEAALQHASRRDGDIRRLVRNQVDRHLEFIVPTKGGKAAAMREWRDRAARQLMDMGADENRARAVAERMDERMMRALANDHYGYLIDTLDTAKRRAMPTGEWTAKGLERVTYMGPRQLSTQQAAALAKAVAQGKTDVVRAAVRQFGDLSEHISEDLGDVELLAEVKRFLKQVDGKLPTAIEDTSTLPQSLVDWASAHPGYQLMLRPDDNNLLVPIRNEAGRITGVHSWIDNVTERTPRIEISRAKAWREDQLRGVAGGEVERNAARRFAANMGEWEGLSERESASVLRAVREAAARDTGSPRGLSTDAILRAVDDAVGLSPARKEVAKRGVADAIFDAYENEARLVGLTPKLTGWVKKQSRPIGGNAVGWMTDHLYPKARFTNNPLFFIQEVPEAAFFLMLQGRYPISGVVPERVARGLANLPIPGVKQVGERIVRSKENTRIWNDKTLILMDRMTRMSPNAEYDMYEASELVRMGLTVAGQMTDQRTTLGKLLKKIGNDPLPIRKQRSVALATRYELGEQWKRSLLENAPEQWLAVRAYYPDEMSDGEVAVQWALDLMARADPDGIYSTHVMGAVNPSHIGRRAEVSDHLVRRFVYGSDEAASRHTWDDLVREVREGTVSIDHVRRDLMNAGADPDYVERTVTKLTFGTADEFYRAARDLGISPKTVKAWRASNQAAAELQGISELEHLSRNYVGRPIHTDQMGNVVGDTLFDDIVESMRVRGKNIPASTSAEVAAQKTAAREMITGVFPEGPIPPQMPKGTPISVRKAANKVRGWEAARSEREIDPYIGAPPMRGQTEAAVPPARFGRDEAGNATVPDVFESKPGYVYRTVHRARMGNDWRVGEYAARHPATIYAADDEHVILRVKQTVSDWEDSTAGVAAHQNMTSRRVIPAGAVEVLGADGKWRPAQAPSFPDALYQTELHTIGMMTPEQYRRQIETMMDPEAMQRRGLKAITEKDALHAIEWYDHIRRAQFALVDDSLTGDERVMAAARLLIEFGTTQLNTSPADGFRHVFKAHGMKVRGETLQLAEARNIVQQAVGLNPEQLAHLVWGEGNKIDQMGIAQKLFDFIDSLTGSKVRTNGIRGPKGDWGPVAVDIHTKRDFGFLDPAMGDWVYRLIERDTPEGLIHGVSSKFVRTGGSIQNGADNRVGHFVVEMSDGTTEVIEKQHIGSGVPTDHEYDYGVELANDIRDHFNETRFMGREWSSYEVQALGWYRMQLLKSSEGDAGAAANAIFEQSRWMGSNDLVPSVDAPLHEVFPWDAVAQPYHRAIHVDGAYHASDEAEALSGARVLTKMDADAVVGGVYRPAQTAELITDPTGAEQYLAHYLYLSEQDSGVLMRDYVGKTNTPRYDKGVGIAVDIPARDEDHAKELLQALAADEGAPLRAFGSHTFIARATDGSLHLRTLWEPGAGASDRNSFNRVLRESGLGAKIEEVSPGTVGHDTLVDFISLKHDWAADPTGKTYMDVIERGSGKHGVMRTAEQRADLVSEYDAAYEAARQRVIAAEAAVARTTQKADRANASEASRAEVKTAADALKAANKALATAKKEHEVARAAPGGRPTSEVQQLVRSARVRVREGVRANFDKYASREVRNERERVLGEARDAAGDALGTDPKWDDVLALATGTNGERLFERQPGGTVRAAITRSSSDDRRAQLHFNRAAVTDKSLLHEEIHRNAWEMDDSAVRSIKGVFAGLEGTPYGTHTPGTPLTEAEHEWLVNQTMLWIENEDSVHPVLAPLMQHFKGKLGAATTLRTQATGPSREAIKRLDGEIAALNVRRAKLKQPAAIARVDADIATKQAQRRAAQVEAKTLRAGGGLSPEVKRVLDEIAAKAGARSETRASTFNADEANMLEWAQIAMTASQRRANDLVHMRGERSALERSINHPFLMMYPTSYIYGKVLPYFAEFLMARPFGMRAPFLAYTMGQSMHQSFQRQQQYDPEFRNYLYKNEPFLRAASMFVPGLPWDLPSGFPIWGRRIMENWLTNSVRRMNGQKEQDLDIPKVIADSALYNLTLRGTDSWSPILEGAQHAPQIMESLLTGEEPPPDLAQPQQP